MEDGYYWLKHSGEPWQVVQIAGNEMYFTGSDVGAHRVDGGPWKYIMYGDELEIEQLVKIEPPNGQGNGPRE